MFAYPTTRKSHTLNSLHNRYTIGQSDTFESNPHSNCLRVKTNSVSLNKLLRAFKPKSFPNWLPTLKSGPSVVLLLFFEFWCRRPRHGACFFYRTLPVSSGCLHVYISEYFCRRRKGHSHVNRNTLSLNTHNTGQSKCVWSPERDRAQGVEAWLNL